MAERRACDGTRVDSDVLRHDGQHSHRFKGAAWNYEAPGMRCVALVPGRLAAMPLMFSSRGSLLR